MKSNLEKKFNCIISRLYNNSDKWVANFYDEYNNYPSVFGCTLDELEYNISKTINGLKTYEEWIYKND